MTIESIKKQKDKENMFDVTFVATDKETGLTYRIEAEVERSEVRHIIQQLDEVISF